MNCEDIVFSRQEILEYAEKEKKQAEERLLTWFLLQLGTGGTLSMVRYQVEKKLQEYR